MNDQMIYQIGLTMIHGVGDILARHLLEFFGDAKAVFKESKRMLEKIPGIGAKHITEIKKTEVLQRAEKELLFIEKNQITPFFITEKNYPQRLKECQDAPILFYFKGKADLSATRIVSIVGTRKATSYGRDLTDKLVAELGEMFPDILIVSGLAYGIDIQAHRSALKRGIPTIAVLAHGLDRIYPLPHRATAIEMLKHGGLLTDFPSGTNPDKPNFVRRNRIIAGLSDATVVVESGEKGGSLITADIASSYGRDVLAFPGRVGDVYSKGCHALIRKNRAGLITSANDLLESLCWSDPKAASIKQDTAVQVELLFSENDEYEQIINLIRSRKEIHINQLAILTNMPVYQLSSLLFELELNNIVKTLPGGMYGLKL